MKTHSINLPQKSSIKSSYNVLVEYTTQERVKASVLGWPECQIEAKTKEEALEQLQQILTQRLRDREIVYLEVEVPTPQTKHPWMQFAGMFKDDPDFEEFMALIEEDRHQLDLEMEEYYRQMDAKEKLE